MPEILQSFEVALPAETVWGLFQDVRGIVACVPGAELDEVLDGNRYRGRLRVKLGALSIQFEGEARITALDPGGKRATIEAQGSDQRGSRASAEVSYTLTDVGSRTRVEVTATYRLQGTIAQFGRSAIIDEVAARLTREFVECLHGRVRAHGQGS